MNELWSLPVSQVTSVGAEEVVEGEITMTLGIMEDNNPITDPWREITLEEEILDLTEVPFYFLNEAFNKQKTLSSTTSYIY